MNPKPGAFGLAVIGGKVGKFVKWAQNWAERQDYIYTHAFLILTNNEVIEAEPTGARIAPLDKYLDRDDVMFCDDPVEYAVHDFVMKNGGYIGYPDGIGVPVNFALADHFERNLRTNISDFGRSLKGVPYSYMDYVSLGLERFGLKVPCVERQVRRPDHLICSQLVDYVYVQNGIHLFDDGRLPNDVTPGDLEYWCYEHTFGVL